MKQLKKISLRKVSDVLNDYEMKQVLGGAPYADALSPYWCKSTNPKCTGHSDCKPGKTCYLCSEDNKKYCA